MILATTPPCTTSIYLKSVVTSNYIMANSEDGSRQRALKFLSKERMEMAPRSRSSFVKSSDGYERSNWKKIQAGDTSSSAQPSSASIFSDLMGLPMDLPPSSEVQQEVGRSKASTNLSETNVGFRLLKKSGWKEGTGLGASEQGRLNPVEAPFKLDRRGIGAEKKVTRRSDGTLHQEVSAEETRETKKSKQEKNLSKKAKKMQEETERILEAAFARDFYREFWPENP